jgi:hypothetical protein
MKKKVHVNGFAEASKSAFNNFHELFICLEFVCAFERDEKVYEALGFSPEKLS